MATYIKWSYQEWGGRYSWWVDARSGKACVLCKRESTQAREGFLSRKEHTCISFVHGKNHPSKGGGLLYKNTIKGTSLVARWLRIHLPMQGTRVQSLVRELRSHMVQGNRACTAQRARALTRGTCVLQRRPNTAKIKNKWKNYRMEPHSHTNKTDSKHLKTQTHTGSKLEEMTQSRKKPS